VAARYYKKRATVVDTVSAATRNSGYGEGAQRTEGLFFGGEK